MPTNPALKEQRIMDLQPIFVLLNDRGIKRRWLADELHIARPRLSKYEHGERGYPDWFIEQASEAIFQAIGVRPHFDALDQQKEHRDARDNHPGPRPQRQQQRTPAQPSKPSTKASKPQTPRTSRRATRDSATARAGNPGEPRRANPAVASGRG